MRVVVLALALALVAGHENLVPSLTPGNTYVYNYDATILGGLPEQNLAKAGLKLVSRVKISAIQENLLILKLEDTEVSEYSDVWSKDQRTTFSKTQLLEALKAHLKTPIKVKYERGIVKEIQAPESVPTRVLNIHRGILNFFQLNIKQTQNSYELQEEGVQGVCKTQYNIMEDQQAERRLVTKGIDLNHCEEKVIRDIGLAYTKTCLKCKELSKNLRGSTGYTYTLKSNSQGGILIEKASGNEVIQFTPFYELNGAATMRTKQHLVYSETEKASIAPDNAEYHPRGTLKYEFSNELLKSPIRLMKMTNVKGQITNILNHLVEDNRERVHEDAPLKYLELIQLLRASDLQQLQSLLNDNRNHPNERRWLMDSIPYIGTKDALELVMEEILKKDVSLPEKIQLLIGSLHMVEPSCEVIEKVWNFAKEPSLQQKVYGPILRKTLLLSYGSLIHRHCADKANCHERDIQRVQELINEAKTTEEIILVVKIMANSGHSWTYKPITKLLPIHGTDGAKLHKRVHIEAILALRSLTKHKQKEVQNKALELYMDNTLNPELRMLALMVLFETKPSMALMTNIVNIVNVERNEHISSFTHSLLKSLARSIGGVHPNVAAECNVALRLLAPQRLNNLNRAVHLEYFNHPLMLGAAARMFYINDAATILPKTLVAKTSSYFAGAAADVLEIGVRSEGFQEYVMKKENSQNSDSTTKMKRILKALSNWKSVPVSEMLGSMYIKVLGQEIASVDVDKPVVEEAIKFASEIDIKQHGMTVLHQLLEHGISKRFVKAMLASEIRRIIPTATGLPMELALYTAAVASADVHAQIQSNLPQDFRLSDILRTKTDIHSEIKPSLAVNTFAVMGVNTDIARAALVARAKVKVNVPAKVSATLNFADGHFKLSALPVSLPENAAVAIDVETQAVALHIARKTPLIPDNISELNSIHTSAASNSREMLDNQQVQDRPVCNQRASRFNKTVCTDTLGLRSCLRVASHNARFIRDSALYRLAGNHQVRLSFKQSEAEIEKWEIELQLGPEGAKKLIKIKNLNLEETSQGTPVLSKLKRFLNSNVRNSNSSSSSRSSSSHQSSHTQSSSSSSSTSKTRITNKVISVVGNLIGGNANQKSSKSSRSSRSSRSSSQSRNDKKSSVSSLDSLFSDSSCSAQSQQHKSSHAKFDPTHQKRTAKRQNSGSVSSQQTFEVIRAQNKLLRDSQPPVFVFILRAVKSDSRHLGYEIAGYQDRENNRIQVIMAAQDPENHWRLVTDAIQLSKHKVAAKIAWGQNTLKYDTMITAETGQVQDKMAARVRVAWKRLPSSIVKDVRSIDKHIVEPYLSNVHRQKRSEQTKQISFTVVVESEKMLNLIFKSRKHVYRQKMQLLITLPINEVRGLMPFDTALDNARYLLAKTTSTECRIDQGYMTTFNSNKYKNVMPISCYQLLVQDCSDKLEFMVLLKKDDEQNYVVNVHIGSHDIVMFPKTRRIRVDTVEETLESRQPYYMDKVKIANMDGTLVLTAPNYGIAELHVSIDKVMVRVSGDMKNKVCGLCGQGNGDQKSDFRKPNGRMADNSVSFAHSWTLPSQSCSDESGCRVKKEHVELERQINDHGVLKTCHSVESVPRCISGCQPTKWSEVEVGFHCRPVGDNSAVQDISERKPDLTEIVQTHLDCDCSRQCA